MDLLKGLYGDNLETVTRINKNYEIYEGKQKWLINENLDYEPTQKITNIIKKLVDTKARFMFGNEPFLDIRTTKTDAENSTTFQDEAQEKEDLLNRIMRDNHFHSKLLKAKKDCSIGGRVAIKLWGHSEKGIKIIFVPAQEFFPVYNIDDIDVLEKITFLYSMNNEDTTSKQRFNKQEWELINGVCYLNEGIYNGGGELVETIESDYNTSLDFIPVIVIQNGGLTGETEGVSDVEQLWGNQDAYNKLISDDIDSLKFNMFPQRVSTDVTASSLEHMTIAPGALVDLQTDLAQSLQGRQAKLEIVESAFSYSDKFQDTVNRTKNDMFDLVDVPNVSLDQLKGLMTSGKSMKTLYWGLIIATNEELVEWKTAIQQLVDYIFKMVDKYDCYKSRKIARYETSLLIENTYPISEDELAQKEIDLKEVIAEVRSRESYINKWQDTENVEKELEKIRLEKQILEQDNYEVGE